MDVLDSLGEGSTIYRAHFNTVTKENNSLKLKIDTLERENRQLKRSVFDLTNRLSKLEWQIGLAGGPGIYDLNENTNKILTSSGGAVRVSGTPDNGYGLDDGAKTVTGSNINVLRNGVSNNGSNISNQIPSAFSRPVSLPRTVTTVPNRVLTPTEMMNQEEASPTQFHSDKKGIVGRVTGNVITATSEATRSTSTSQYRAVIDSRRVLATSPVNLHAISQDALTGVVNFEEDNGPISSPLNRNGVFHCDLELKEHSGAVYCLAWSPNGTLLSSGSFDKNVIVSKMSIGDENENESSSVVLSGHDKLVSEVCWTCDGAKVVSSSFDHTVRVWDHSSERQVHSFTLNGFVVCADSHSSDSSLFFAGTEKGVINMFDMRAADSMVMPFQNDNKASIYTVHAPKNPIMSNYIYTGDNKGMIRLWDIRSLKKMEGYDILNEEAQRPITHITCSPASTVGETGRIMAVNSYDNILRIYDSHSRISYLSKQNNDPGLHPDRDKDKNVALDLCAAVKGHRNKNFPIKSSFYSGPAVESFTGNRKSKLSLLLATGSASHSCYVFSVDVGMENVNIDISEENSVSNAKTMYANTNFFAKLDGHAGRVYSCEFHPSQQIPLLATASADSAIRVWTI